MDDEIKILANEQACDVHGDEPLYVKRDGKYVVLPGPDRDSQEEEIQTICRSAFRVIRLVGMNAPAVILNNE